MAVPHELTSRVVANRFVSGEVMAIDAMEFQNLENMIVSELLPLQAVSQATRSAAELNWSHRKLLIDEISGKKYHGQLVEVNIESMPDAYDALVEQSASLARKNREEGVCDTIGFIVCAELQSSAMNDIGELIKPVWLVRTPARSISLTNVGWRRIVGSDKGNNKISELHTNSLQRAKYLNITPSTSKRTVTRRTLD